MLPLLVIKLNSTGPAVTRWQHFLLEQGYSLGAAGADGNFGYGTKAATISFQLESGIPADGVVGNRTYAAAIVLGFNAVLDIADFIGIDVFHGDGDIDWDAVNADPQDVQFAYIKATEGATVQDPKYAANIAQATAVGLQTGAYHFFSLTSPPQLQAANFIQSVGSMYPYTMPPVIDFEKEVGTADVAATIASLTTWLELVQNKWDIQPVIYTSKHYWDQLGNPSGFENYQLWLANYNSGLPALPGQWPEWAIWQCTDQGTVQGINNQVDLNRYNLNSGLIPV